MTSSFGRLTRPSSTPRADPADTLDGEPDGHDRLARHGAGRGRAPQKRCRSTRGSGAITAKARDRAGSATGCRAGVGQPALPRERNRQLAGSTSVATRDRIGGFLVPHTPTGAPLIR